MKRNSFDRGELGNRRRFPMAVAPATVRSVMLLLSLSQLSACSFGRATLRDWGFVKWFPEPPVAQAHSAVATGAERGTAQQMAKDSPFEISVHQAFFVGQRLVVKAKLMSKADVRAAEVVVGVQGVKEGQVLSRNFRPLSQVVGDEMLRQGRSVIVDLELDAADINEYQLVCSWGEDARQVIAGLSAAEAKGSDALNTYGSDASAPAPDGGRASFAPSNPEAHPSASEAQPGGSVKSDAVLAEVELEQSESPCNRPPCDLRYTIRARLVNTSGKALTGAHFAVGLVWGTDEALPKTPPDFEPLRSEETAVDLPELAVDAAGSKRLKIAVDRSIPQVPGGRFFPYVRIVAVDSSAPNVAGSPERVLPTPPKAAKVSRHIARRVERSVRHDPSSEETHGE